MRKKDRIRQRLRHTGFSQELFEKRLSSQKGKCAICEIELTIKPCADHCHESGFQRGILCMKCNVGLGMFGDNPALLAAAEKYLRFWEAVKGRFL